MHKFEVNEPGGWIVPACFSGAPEEFCEKARSEGKNVYIEAINAIFGMSK